MPGPATLSSSELDLAIVDRKAALTGLKLPPAPYKYPRVSPDGKGIALETDDGQEAVVRIYEPVRAAAPPRRLTFAGKNRFPIWTSDNRRVVFQSDRQGDLGIFWQAADGTGDAERLTTAAANESHVPESWHPSAGVMLFSVEKNGEYTLWTYSVHDKKTSPFSGVRSSIPTDAVFSPDGRWVAYSSGTYYVANIYVEPFPATGAKYELPRTGAGGPHHPVWLPDGKTLVFNQRAGNIDDISIVTSPTFGFGNTVSRPKRFDTGPPNVRRAYDVMPDGRIVGLIAPGDAESASASWRINVVLNWFEELNQRMRTR
jgi:Tol biopolymer transport system component